MKQKQILILQLVSAVVALAIALTMGISYHRISKIPNEIAGKEIEPLQISEDDYSYETVNSLCDDPKVKKELAESTLKFEEPTPADDRKTVCPWGLGDNMVARVGKLATRYEQAAVASLPAKSVLCSLEAGLEPTPFSRQHFFMLTLNGRILVTDAEFLFQYFQEEKVHLSDQHMISSYTYDWSRILGMRLPKGQNESNRREYCIGRDISLANCSFTNGQNPSLEMNPSLVRWLGSKSIGPNLRFNLIVTGDGDVNGDCSHTPLTLHLKAKYAIRQ